MPYFTSSTKLVVPSLPEASSRIYTAGETVRGSVELSLAGKEGEGPTIQELTVSLRCHQVSTYLVHYGQGTDYRVETIKLLEQDVVLFTASASQPLGGPSELIRHFPFEFTLPPLNYNLPSTFQGGRRSSNIEGGDVGKIDWFIKVTGRKDKTFSINERYKLPFVYMRPSTLDLNAIPPPLVPEPKTEKDTLSPYPPRQPTREEGWFTTSIEKDYREHLLGKKSRVRIQLSLPLLPTYPSLTPIPYHLSLLLLSPPSSSTSSPPSSYTPLAPSDLTISLIRNMYTRARGSGSQKFHQDGGELVDLSREKRVWYGEPGWRKDVGEDGKEEGERWGAEVVVVGEMRARKEVGTTFAREESEKGLLACDFHIKLKMPLKGQLLDLKADPFLPIHISSSLMSTSSNSMSDAFPPSYFEVGDGDDDDEKGGKDKK